MGHKSSSPNIKNAKTSYDYKEHSKAFNIVSEKEKRIKEEIKSWKSNNSLKEDITSESHQITENSDDDFSSLISAEVDNQNDFENLIKNAKLQDDINSTLKNNGLDQLDHIASDELLIKLLKHSYAIKVEPRNSVEYDKQIDLKNYIKDFEKQVRNHLIYHFTYNIKCYY